MRKQCVPDASPFFARAGDEATSIYAECTGLYRLCWVTHSIEPINGHALAVTCRLSNLHPVLIHVFLLCVQCDHPLSFIYSVV